MKVIHARQVSAWLMRKSHHPSSTWSIMPLTKTPPTILPELVYQFPANMIRKAQTHSITDFSNHIKHHFLESYSYDCFELNCYVCNNRASKSDSPYCMYYIHRNSLVFYEWTIGQPEHHLHRTVQEPQKHALGLPRGLAGVPRWA